MMSASQELNRAMLCKGVSARPTNYPPLAEESEDFKRPEKTAEMLLLEMEADGPVETVDLLREHVDSL
jgi:hypothetical protein